jgi:hypothetical protein
VCGYLGSNQAGLGREILLFVVGLFELSQLLYDFLLLCLFPPLNGKRAQGTL